MDISIIIVSFNTKKLLVAAIDSIRKYTKGLDYEIIVVDNASHDGSRDTVKKIKGVKLVSNKENVGFARANNQGVKIAKGRYILFLNSDTQVLEDSISKMVHWMDNHPEAGAATCKLVNPDGSVQGTGGMFPDLFRVFLWAKFLDDLPIIPGIFGSYHPHTPKFFTKNNFYNGEHEQDWVTGAFVLVRRGVLDKVSGWDEDFFMYVEDIDFCLRIKKAGWQIWYVPTTFVVHIGKASTQGEGVKFGDAMVGKENSILGEFNGLKILYKKHYPAWQYPLLEFLLKVAAFLRYFVFGILKGDREALRIYAKALANN